MSFISPQPCTTQVDEDGQCCPNTFIGFCLGDGTPISITIQAGTQLGWTNLLTGVFSSGPPPIGTVVCATDQVAVAIACETHSITVCQNETAWVTDYSHLEDSPHISGDVGAFVLAVRNDAGTPLAANGDYIPFTTDATGALRVTTTGGSGFLDCVTDSVTICPGADPIDVVGTVAATQGTSPWIIGDGGGSITVDAVDLDIRNLVFSTDKVDVSGSIVALDAGTLAALETITVLQGTSPWAVSGTVTADTNFDYPEDSIHVSGNPGAFVLAVRNDAGTPLAADGDYIPFTTDNTGALRVNATFSGTVTVALDCATDSVTICPGVDPIVVTGTVELGSTTLAALETITVNQGTSPWVIGDGGGSITVDGAVTADTNFDYPEDSVHVSGDAGAFVLAVRNDAGTPLAGNGDYIPFTTDSSGSLRVTIAGGSSVTQTGRDDTDNQATVATGLLTSVDRNYIWDSVGGNWDRWTGAVTQGTSPWVVSGTITANQGTSPWITSLDAATLAALESITIQNPGGASAVNIQDGGNSITVDGTVSISGTVTVDTNFDYAEDAPHVSGDVGAFVLAVRNDANAALTNTNGDYSPIAVNANGAVAISDGGNSITVDGTLGVTQSTSPWVVSGTVAATQSGSWSVTILNGTGAAAVNIQDGGNSITVDGSVSISGTVTTADNKIEDAVHTTGDTGSFILAVRNDTNTAFTNNNGDYSPIAVNSNGAIAINDGGNSITVDGTVAISGTVAVTQSTSPWIVSGTVTANQGTSPWVTSLDAASLAALESITVQNGAGGAAVNIQDGGNSITVDGAVTVSGTVATNSERAEDSGHTSGQIGNFVLGVRNDAAATLTSTDLDYTPFATDAAGRIGISDLGGSISIDDNGGSITVDGTVAATQSGAWSVTILNGAGAAAVNIQDGGNSITVDGTVSISGTVTVDTELPVASALVDADPNPTTSRIGSNNLVFNGTTWDRVRAGTATGSIIVNNATAANLLATVTIDAASLAALESITVQNPGGASAVNIQDGGNSITVDGTVSVSGTVAVTQSTSPWIVSGTVSNSEAKLEDVPHVSGDSGFAVWGVRNDAAAVRTSTDGDYSPISTDSAGRVGISDLGGSISIDDNGGSITVDGSVAVTQSTSPWVTSLDAASLAALESITVQNPGGASAVNIQDGGNSITVDGTVSVSGTVAVTQSTSPWIVSGTVTATSSFAFAEDVPHVSGDIGAFILAVRNDANAAFTNTNGDYSPIAVNSAGAVAINDGGNSITVDGTVDLGATSLAALESITVQNPAGASAVNIQDGGNSITVDGTVSISGTVTVDTELPAASALADTDPNPTTSRIGANNLVFNGTTWDRVRAGTATGSILVNNPTAANLLATVTIDAASLAALESITVQNPGGASAVNIQDGGNSITVDGTVSIFGVVAVTQSTSPWVVSGTVATNSERAEDSGHTSGQIGNFVLGVRNDTASVLTSTDLDYTPFATDSAGRIGVSDLGGAISIDDNGGSITVDGTIAATQSGSWSVTILNGAGAAAVNIQDGGNSITVDGTVAATQSGTWTTTNNNGVGAAAVNIQDGGNSITVDGTVTITQPTGTITNGAETAVAAVAVQILAANANRKKYFIQNTGTANIRVGVSGVTATTGVRLVPSGTILMEMPNCPTQAIFAIRESATSSIAFAQEVT